LACFPQDIAMSDHSSADAAHPALVPHQSQAQQSARSRDLNRAPLGGVVQPWLELNPPGQRVGDPPPGIEKYAARPTMGVAAALAHLEHLGARLEPASKGRPGALLYGLDGRHVEPTTADALRALVWEHQLVVIRGQTLDDEQLLGFARTVGEPQIYFGSNYHHPKHPQIFVSSNVPMEGQKVGVANTGAFWHSDYQFFSHPLPMTMVTPRRVPSGSRGTLFIDMAMVYERLPSGLRNWVDRTRAIHEVKWRYKIQASDIDKSITQILQEFGADTPPMTHPTAITHPINGRRSVYVSRGFTVGLVDHSIEQSHRLLAELMAFVEREEHVHCQLWSLGDCLLWDNRQLIHMARGGTPGEPSTSYRVGVHDGRPFNGDEPQGGRPL
jgi:taurine dioxygenase